LDFVQRVKEKRPSCGFLKLKKTASFPGRHSLSKDACMSIPHFADKVLFAIALIKFALGGLFLLLEHTCRDL
jgi:hypothetical protein